MNVFINDSERHLFDALLFFHHMMLSFILASENVVQTVEMSVESVKITSI